MVALTPLTASECAELARIKRLLDPLLPETSKALFGAIDRLASEWMRSQSIVTSALAEAQKLSELADANGKEVARLREELQSWMGLVLGGEAKPSTAVVELEGWKEEK
jgi:hydroxymethylpyrimidine/phosphomethylpyrimidine kinase